MSLLCGVAADDLYQASGFRSQLHEMLFIPEIHKDLALPITRDPPHLLNLGVTDALDSKSESAEFFRVFIKRRNVFNHILSLGKGLSFFRCFKWLSLHLDLSPMLDKDLQVPPIINDLRLKEVYQAIAKSLKFFILTEKKPRNSNI